MILLVFAVSCGGGSGSGAKAETFSIEKPEIPETDRFFDEVKSFLEAGGNPNDLIESDSDVTSTWLQRASSRGYLASANLLIESGADVDATNNRGETALMEARNAEITQLLIYAGADVNATNSDGLTALMGADFEIAELLI